MSLVKVTLASILLASLTACSGGGNKGGNTQAGMPESRNIPKEKKDNTEISSSPQKTQKELEYIKEANRLKIKELGKEYSIGLHKDVSFGQNGKKISIYNQNYSLMYIQDIGDGKKSIEKTENIGIFTKVSDLPSEVFTYEGIALNLGEQGKLSYTVDFTKKTGKGSVSNLSIGTLNLKEANIHISESLSILGDVENRGTYNVQFYGPNAEEILGEMILDDNSKIYGLAGSRE